MRLWEQYNCQIKVLIDDKELNKKMFTVSSFVEDNEPISYIDMMIETKQESLNTNKINSKLTDFIKNTYNILEISTGYDFENKPKFTISYALNIKDVLNIKNKIKEFLFLEELDDITEFEIKKVTPDLDRKGFYIWNEI